MFGWMRKLFGRRNPTLKGGNNFTKSNLTPNATQASDAYLMEKAAKHGENSLSTRQKMRLNLLRKAAAANAAVKEVVQNKKLK